MPGIPSFFQVENLENLSGNRGLPEKSNHLKWLVLSVFCLLIGAASIALFSKNKQVPQQHLIYLKGQIPDFAGRKNYLDVLYKDLVLSRNLKPSYPMKLLWGKGGYGKSELAIEFANRFHSDFSLIWTFYCDNQEHIEQGYRNLAEKLGLLKAEEPAEKIKEKVHFYLENHPFRKPWLLIYDNVEEELTSYPQRGGAILVTSQKRVLNPEFILEVQPFTKKESLELLTKITKEKHSIEMEQLAQDLEGIPLLINYAAHYVKATPTCTLADYQKTYSDCLYEKEGPLWRQTDVNHRYLKSLAASWDFTLKSLEKENSEALKWLYVCSYFYPEKIPQDWILDWLRHDETSAVDSSKLEMIKEKLLQSLQTYGIIRYDEKTRTLSLHRFFQHLIRESRKDQREEDLAQAIATLAKHANDFQFSETSSWKQGEVWYLHASEVGKWLSFYHPRLSTSSAQLQAARLYDGIADYCLFNDRFQEALEANYRVLDFKIKIFDCKSPEIGKTHQNIGWTLMKLARFEEGLIACHRAAEIQHNLNGKYALDYALTLTTQGRILYQQGEYESALKCHTKAFHIRLENLGEFHVEVGRSLFNITRCFNKMGRNEEVFSLHKRVKKIYQKTCGIQHPYYAWSLEIKARAAHDLKRYKEAIEFYTEALDILRLTRGVNHGELALSWDGIGWCHYQLGQYRKARKTFEQAFKLGSYYGANTVVSVRSHRALGWTYIKLGEREKGFGHLLLWIEGCSQIYKNAPKMETSCIEFQKAWAEISNDVGKTKYLLDGAAKACKICQEALGEDHPVTKFFRNLTQ